MPVPNVDRLAGMLLDAARMARRMPPSWIGDRLTIRLGGPQGQYFGKLLPGTGVYVPWDLDRLGITRPLAGIYTPSQVCYGQDVVARLTDRLALPVLGHPWYRTRVGRLFCPDRAGVQFAAWGAGISRTTQTVKQLAATITTYDGIITGRGLQKGEDAAMAKQSFTTVAQQFSTLFRAGGVPEAGTYTNIPGGAVHTRASTGAWHGLTSPTNPDKKYLLTFGFGSSSAIDWLILVDLLVACGNISASITSGQTVNSTAQTRQYGSTLGAGVWATLEVTTALGTGTGTFTLSSYTDQDGNTAAASQAGGSPASAIVNRLMPDTTNTAALPPWIGFASGDFGIRSVETFTFSAAHSAGVLALNLAFPLMYIPGLAANIYVERDSTVQIDGLTELDLDGSDVIGCLVPYVQTNSTSSGVFKGFARTVEG